MDDRARRPLHVTRRHRWRVTDHDRSSSPSFPSAFSRALSRTGWQVVRQNGNVVSKMVRVVYNDHVQQQQKWWWEKILYNESGSMYHVRTRPCTENMYLVYVDDVRS